MADAATYTAAGLLLAFACYRFVVDRRGEPEPAKRYVRLFALSIGAALLVLAPHTMAVLDGHGRAQRLAVLAGAELKLCGLTCLALVARTVAGSDPRPARRPVRQALAAGLALAVLFAPARMHGITASGSGYATGSGRWFLAAYDVLFIGYALRCLVVFITLPGRHARRIEPSPLRTGLNLMTMSAAVGAVWTLWLLTDVVRVLRCGRQDTAEDPQSAVLAVAVVVLAVGGATATVWGGPLMAPCRTLRASRAYRALEPLWAALYEAHPSIALASPGERGRRAARPGPRQVQFALYRRVIEIHDGRLSLRPYCPRDVTDWLAARLGAGGEHTDEVIEAASLAAGLEARRAGLEPPVRQSAAPPQAAAGTGTGCVGTIDADVAWLLRVAEAFAALAAAGPGPDAEKPRPGRGDQAGAVAG